jgi:hypothetical protein
MATTQEVEQFLIEVKDKIRFFDVVFRPRDKNLQALTDLDITANKRKEILLNLKAEDYYAGPKPDTYDSTRPDYYEFGIEINKTLVYIKLSPGLTNKPADCMSFHVAEFPMTHPLKPKNDETKN